MEFVNCIFCPEGTSVKSADFARKHLNLVFPLSVSRCSNCGLLFMNPRPDKQEREQFFNGNIPENLRVYARRPADYGVVTNTRREKFRERAKYFAELIESAAAKVLDVGASSGVFLEEIEQLGHEGYGIEPSLTGVETCKSKGLNVVQGFAEKLPFEDGFFDLVHSNHVFEHLANPLLAIKEAFRVLKPGGIVFVEVPNQFDNIQFFRYRIVGKVPVRDRNFRSIHHLYFFSRKTLRKLLLTGGFKQVRVTDYYGRPRSGIGKLGSYAMRLVGKFYLGGPFLCAIGYKQRL